MFRRRKTDAAIWINPRLMKRLGHIAWDRRKTDVGNARYLELADVAPESQNRESKYKIFNCVQRWRRRIVRLTVPHDANHL